MAAGPWPLFCDEYDPEAFHSRVGHTRSCVETLMRITGAMAQGMGNSLYMKLTHAEAEQIILDKTAQFLEDNEFPMQPAFYSSSRIKWKIKMEMAFETIVGQGMEVFDFIDDLICHTPDTYGAWSAGTDSSDFPLPITIEFFSIDEVLHAWPERLEELIKERMWNALINRRIDNG